MSVSINQSSLMIAFSVLPDPRKERNRVYSLFDLVATAVLATLCACDDYQEISDWATFHLEWLQSRGMRLNGVPSHDTYERFFRRYNRKLLIKKIERILLPNTKTGIQQEYAHEEGYHT